MRPPGRDEWLVTPVLDADEQQELAQKLSNPMSDLVSVPFQFNWYQNVGPLELSTFILNVQPVIPLKLNDDWNLILRIIVPFIGQPPLFDGDVSTFGIGDITTSFFSDPVPDVLQPDPQQSVPRA